MNINHLLEMDQDSVIEWLIDNKEDYVILPTELTTSMLDAIKEDIADIVESLQYPHIKNDAMLRMHYLAAIRGAEDEHSE